MSWFLKMCDSNMHGDRVKTECILIFVLWFFCACSSCVACWDHAYFRKIELDFYYLNLFAKNGNLLFQTVCIFLMWKNSVSIECNRKCTTVVAFFYSLCNRDRPIIIALCLHLLTCNWKSLQDFGIDPIPSLWHKFPAVFPLSVSRRNINMFL
jgi:hypothetical protein